MNFAAVASILSAAFAVVVGLRWWRSRAPSFACWALGFTIVALAAGLRWLRATYWLPARWKLELLPLGAGRFQKHFPRWTVRSAS